MFKKVIICFGLFFWSNLSANLLFNYKIQTHSNYSTKVEQLKIGDEVFMAIQTKSGFEFRSLIVARLDKHFTQELIVIITDKENIVIDSTQEIFEPKRVKWVLPKELKAGDFILNKDLNLLTVYEIASVILKKPIQSYKVFLNTKDNPKDFYCILFGI